MGMMMQHISIYLERFSHSAIQVSEKRQNVVVAAAASI